MNIVWCCRLWRSWHRRYHPNVYCLMCCCRFIECARMSMQPETLTSLLGDDWFLDCLRAVVVHAARWRTSAMLYAVCECWIMRMYPVCLSRVLFCYSVVIWACCRGCGGDDMAIQGGGVGGSELWKLTSQNFPLILNHLHEDFLSSCWFLVFSLNQLIIHPCQSGRLNSNSWLFTLNNLLFFFAFSYRKINAPTSTFPKINLWKINNQYTSR